MHISCFSRWKTLISLMCQHFLPLSHVFHQHEWHQANFQHSSHFFRSPSCRWIDTFLTSGQHWPATARANTGECWSESNELGNSPFYYLSLWLIKSRYRVKQNLLSMHIGEIHSTCIPHVWGQLWWARTYVARLRAKIVYNQCITMCLHNGAVCAAHTCGAPWYFTIWFVCTSIIVGCATLCTRGGCTYGAQLYMFIQ